MYDGICEDYELPGNEAWCRYYGNAGDGGMTPNENCCVCKAQLIDDTNTVLEEDDDNTAVPSTKPSLSPTVRLYCYVLFSNFFYFDLANLLFDVYIYINLPTVIHLFFSFPILMVVMACQYQTISTDVQIIQPRLCQIFVDVIRALCLQTTLH